MNNKNLAVFLISLCALTYVIFFQNCSSGTNFSSVPDAPSTAATAAPVESDTALNSPNLELKIVHTNGHRDILVTTTGLSVTDSQCRLQYKKNSTAWTDFEADFICNTDLNSFKFLLPSGDDWTNNFSTAKGGVQIRLVKANNQAVVGEFTQKLNCDNKAAAASETPLIDENCNGRWNDKDLGSAAIYRAASAAKNFGAFYTCPTVGVKTATNKDATFVEMEWNYSTGLYSSATCEYTSYLFNVSGPGQKITSPNPTGVTPEHVYMPEAGTCAMASGYKIVNNVVEEVIGYAWQSGEWTTAHCVYSYYPNTLFY